MRAVIAAAFILATGPAVSEESWQSWTTRPPFIQAAPACQDHFPDLPKMAERLGVPEYKGSGPTTVLMMCDGRKFALLELVGALLDRMDRAAAAP
jgi:hypothetical protein